MISLQPEYLSDAADHTVLILIVFIQLGLVAQKKTSRNN